MPTRSACAWPTTGVPLTDPQLLWLNTGLLVLSSVLDALGTQCGRWARRDVAGDSRR
ncbi:MAG: hypothetical protein U5K38_08900 [Woeseiaceae bacterium]|nr:hypothetical protein [Woeseiaceae bacterium]